MKLTLCAALLGAAAAVFPAAGAQAAPVSPMPVPWIDEGSPLMTPAADHRMRHNWDRHRDGRRCSTRNGRCRHYHGGYWYESPWWTLPLIGGAIINESVRRDRGYSRHVEWCLDHYRSYNIRTNTWVSYSGDVRECISPYNS